MTDTRRREILQAALSFVPQHGWTRKSLALGCCSLFICSSTFSYAKFGQQCRLKASSAAKLS